MSRFLLRFKSLKHSNCPSSAGRRWSSLQLTSWERKNYNKPRGKLQHRNVTEWLNCKTGRLTMNHRKVKRMLWGVPLYPPQYKQNISRRNDGVSVCRTSCLSCVREYMEAGSEDSLLLLMMSTRRRGSWKTEGCKLDRRLRLWSHRESDAV